jgi:hypothetical protein
MFLGLIVAASRSAPIGHACNGKSSQELQRAEQPESNRLACWPAKKKKPTAGQNGSFVVYKEV